MKKAKWNRRHLVLKVETLLPMQRDALGHVRGGVNTNADDGGGGAEAQSKSILWGCDTYSGPCTTMRSC